MEPRQLLEPFEELFSTDQLQPREGPQLVASARTHPAGGWIRRSIIPHQSISYHGAAIDQIMCRARSYTGHRMSLMKPTYVGAEYAFKRVVNQSITSQLPAGDALSTPLSIGRYRQPGFLIGATVQVPLGFEWLGLISAQLSLA